MVHSTSAAVGVDHTAYQRRNRPDWGVRIAAGLPSARHPVAKPASAILGAIVLSQRVRPSASPIRTTRVPEPIGGAPGSSAETLGVHLRLNVEAQQPQALAGERAAHGAGALSSMPAASQHMRARSAMGRPGAAGS
jgi:hypothetical protein